jgi:hypothetical protein
MENIFTSYVMENIFYILCYGEHFYILRYGEKFKDTKWVIRSRKSQNDRQFNGQNERDKKTNNDIQNTTH